MSILPINLSFTNVLLLFVATFVIYNLIWILYARFLHPLRHIPGPFLASTTRFWIIIVTLQGNMDKVQRRLHEEYGPIVRIAPDEVACADPEAIRTIYSTQKPLTKSEFYPPWGNKSFSKYEDNFSVVDEKMHGQRRRIVNNVYSLSSVLRCEPSMDECVDLFVTRLYQCAGNGKSTNLGEWLQW